MGNESDILRTGVEVVIVMERVAIDMVTVHVMEMVVAMETDTGIQKVAVTLMAIDTGKTGMEEEVAVVAVAAAVVVEVEEEVAAAAAAGMGKAEMQMMVGMGKAGKKIVIVRARWTPRWTIARWTRWTARQIRQLMALLFLSPPNARKVDGTVRGYMLKGDNNCVNFILRGFW